MTMRLPRLWVRNAKSSCRAKLTRSSFWSLHRYVDSRLCPSVTNISINVARPINFFGITQVANPAAAHRDYDQDERVIEIIAHGVGRAGVSPLLDERCSWVETVDVD